MKKITAKNWELAYAKRKIVTRKVIPELQKTSLWASDELYTYGDLYRDHAIQHVAEKTPEWDSTRGAYSTFVYTISRNFIIDCLRRSATSSDPLGNPFDHEARADDKRAIESQAAWTKKLNVDNLARIARIAPDILSAAETRTLKALRQAGEFPPRHGSFQRTAKVCDITAVNLQKTWARIVEHLRQEADNVRNALQKLPRKI